MSWSVYAKGRVSDVMHDIAKQFGAISLADAGEMETVKNIDTLVAQTLSTFDQAGQVNVEAYGSISYVDWSAKTGCSQEISVRINPIRVV